MTKKTYLSLFVVIVLALLVPAFAGCGGDEGTTTAKKSELDEETSKTAASRDNESDTSDSGADLGDLESQLGELDTLEATVEVISNGESVVKWSQKKGSWRWDDPSDATSYVIYNKSEDKLWVVSDGNAVETAGVGDQGQAWMGQSPAAMVGAFSALPGNMSGDTLEVNVPGGGSVKIEFKGPQGLPTKMTTEDATTGETDVVEFKYSNVGSVPDSYFELPSNVQVTSMPDTSGLGGDMEGLDSIPNIPDTSNLPNAAQ